MSFQDKVKKAFDIWRANDWNTLKNHLYHHIQIVKERRNYQKWIREKDTLDEAKRAEIRQMIAGFERQPLISVLMPVYETEEKWLRLAIESVRKQLYENWELCIADDCSPSPRVRRILEEYAAKDARIKIIFRETNGHISAASNSALELATGEFAALFDHDDELAETALFYVAKEINDFAEVKMIYSDEDLIDEKGRRFEGKFKPDWSRDLFYSFNLVTHLSAYRTDILRRVGGFRVGTEGSQDYDLTLRFIEEISETDIRHIPKILYHWRTIRGSVAFSMDEKPYAHERAREVIRGHFARTGKKASVSESIYHLHRVRYELPDDLPKVSLILAVDEDSKAVRQAVKTFSEQTEYGNFEIVLVGLEKTKAKLEAENLSRNVKFIVCEKQSEAEKFNFAASQTNGEILCFTDANLRPLVADWLKELASFAYQKEIGAVGAKILETNEKILHGGLIIGAGDAVGVAHQGFPREANGNLLRTRVVNNFSAVSVSCLATRRACFQSAGGFDAINLPDKFFDADFCLKLREENYRIVFTPYAELIKIEKEKRLNLEKNPTAKEKEYFVQKWREIMTRDPFYNPNLSKKDASFSIEI